MSTTMERLGIARDLELWEAGVSPEAERGKSLRTLRARFDYLVGIIRKDDCSDGARLYHVAEARALHWALKQLESGLSAS